MTEIHYDTEFLEDGATIALISIGMVREDGAELYLINERAPLARLITHSWLMEHVVPSLPIARDQSGNLSWNMLHPDAGAITHPNAIAHKVAEFITGVQQPQLWADYCAYDHVALCQIWGPMVKLPEGVPMWTHDLRQEVERLGSPQVPELPGKTEHNALWDAREVKYRREWLRDYAVQKEAARLAVPGASLA
jgi:hypothetical protein